MKVQSLSCLTLCDPMDVARQALLSMEFSRREYWSGLPFLSPGDIPNPQTEPCLPHCRQILYHLSHKGEESYKSKTLKSSMQTFQRENQSSYNGSQSPIKSGFIAPVTSFPSTHLPVRSALIMGCGLRM